MSLPSLPRILIVDDEAPARARLTTLLSDIAAECPHALIGEASQAQQALDKIAELAPDIVLLDVQMPGMTGLEMAAHLAHSEAAAPAPAIIFVTAYDEYALQAFEVHALDYLLKPVRATRLADAIRRVRALKDNTASQAKLMAAVATTLQATRKNFSVQERGRLLLVPVADVLYLKAEAKYVTLRTREREYLLEGALSSLELEFAAQFIRVHRNALVARDAITGVERGQLTVDADSDGESDKAQDAWQVILRGIDDRLPISRRQWSAVKALVR
ncbi:LytR/AlgR family response regulator transcription factor [Herminiimonas fonticola]|uniref:LytTR family two component transcriptional regulator n=1 Tax=Herminiimonas fonticola TaxID=303380 RepID=A0A4R6G5V4_9BURK|nr:LytTR family DNA-binding domain-containing protein [Herminiimonas fonticola]RBA23909.1 Response regulator of the LytR/AlgR family [Herminiimonas fonticola]TDN89909.1 LytTR family two component transcriptional regulator [Herminiimonas fonticola]